VLEVFWRGLELGRADQNEIEQTRIAGSRA
jgi:hypothetical protein